MPSAFRRAGKATTPSSATNSGNDSHKQSSPSLLGGLKGVKPWTGGIHLTSSGLNDLDAILGGGQPLGTCILIQEDRWTRDLALSLVKYWCAEAISQDHRLIVPVCNEEKVLDFMSDVEQSSKPTFAAFPEIENLLQSLPRNLHWDKQKQKMSQETDPSTEPAPTLGILEEGDDDDEGQQAEEGLEIAWQYKKSVQQERLGIEKSKSSSSASLSNIFCHSYDLSGKMNDQTKIDVTKFVVHIASSHFRSKNTQLDGMALFRKLAGLMKGEERQAIRLLLFHPDLEVMEVTLPLLLAHIRANSIPAVVVMCSRASPDLKSWIRLSRSSDVVLSTEGFSSRREYPPPPEFRHLHGLLTISKVSTTTAATANGAGHYGDLTISKRPAAFIFGFKRDRRKLHIPLLHIPPEDYAAGGGSTSGVRSGAGKPPDAQSKTRGSGMGCASNLSGSSLDF